MRMHIPMRVARVIRRLRPSGNDRAQFVPPGHYYSPIPSLDEVRTRQSRLFPAHVPSSLPGLDLNVEEQLRVLEAFKTYYRELPLGWEDTRAPGPPLRYTFSNDLYSYSDAICLYGMIRHLRPKRIIEIGSGFSSAVMLDTNELFCSDAIRCTFIDPYPQRLEALLRDADRDQVEMIARPVQDVDLSTFAALRQSDILFVDSTHVAKIGSDVNHIIFTILPMLQAGVHIHFHDIFYGFEYPMEWIYNGRAWNEAYLLRAFLQYNQAFRIVFFNTFLEHFFEREFARHMPLCLKNPGGSLWLRKAS
jgi:predicted O-methyltransferase YrrM